jgi:hypothetical protein
MSNKEIAALSVIDIAETTIRNRLENIPEMLHLKNSVQDATYVLRDGLVRPPPERPDLARFACLAREPDPELSHAKHAKSAKKNYS